MDKNKIVRNEYDLPGMFEKIETYHKELGYNFTTEKNPDKPMEHLRNLTLALHTEVTELLDSFPWKPWRAMKDQKYDYENAKEEIVDIIFFLAGICEVTGITAEAIEDKFIVKLAANYNRINYGYNNKAEDRR